MRFEEVDCNVCGRDNAVFVGKRMPPSNDTKLETNIVRCSFCGLMYPNPMPRMERREIESNFSDAGAYFPGAAENIRRIRKKTMRLLEKSKPAKGSLLDIGCGRGGLLAAAKIEKWDVTGTEISKSFARYARETFGVNVLVGDIDDLPLPQGNFDAASLSSVIQYVRDPLNTLKKINLLLKKGGILYIEVTNNDALVFKIGDLFKSIRGGSKITTRLSPLFPSYQLYGFNKRSLTKALDISGFDMLYFRVKGLTGGGGVKGRSFLIKILRAIKGITIAIGGLAQNGHLIYCIAKKRSENDTDCKT